MEASWWERLTEGETWWAGAMFSKSLIQFSIEGWGCVPSLLFQFTSVLSHVRLFANLNRSMPGLPVHHQLLEFTQTHVHWVSDAIQPSLLCHPLLLLPPIPPSIRVFSNESTLCMKWPKYWSFSFSISLSNEHPGLISFRMDWLGLLAAQGTLKSLLQHSSSKASIFWHSAFFTVQLSHPYMTTGKTIASLLFTCGQTVVQVMKIMMTSFKKSHAYTATLSAPNPAGGYCWPMPLLETSGDTYRQVWSVSCGVTGPFSWVLVCTGSVCAHQEFPSPV